MFKTFSLYCNSTAGLNKNITWVQTVNKTGIYPVFNVDNIATSVDGQQLNFANITLSDEEYYGCGFINGSVLTLYNSYFLYVRCKFKNKLMPSLIKIFPKIYHF